MSSPVLADELKFPDYKECEPVGSSKTHACFDFAGMKVLLKINEKRLTLQEINQDLKEILNGKESIIRAQGKQIGLLKNSLQVSKGEADHWFRRWKEENEKRHEAENEPRFNEYLGWGTAGVFAVSSIVLGTLVVEDRVF